MPEDDATVDKSAAQATDRQGGSSRVRPSRTAGSRSRKAAADPGVETDAASTPASAAAAPSDAADVQHEAQLDAPDRSERPSSSAPATGRIQVPVPSVVRARERGRLAEHNPVVLRTESLTKSYGTVIAANEVTIDVHAGSFTGIVGPNGAGKTTTLSMLSGLNRPTSGRVTVRDVDVWADGAAAKRLIGTLPDRLRLFDRLTGAQLMYYSGVLHGVEESAVAQRVAELAEAFSLESALGRLVSDYSAGMQKKIALACSMIHAPDVLVLDEPFEAIDPVSASNVTEILEKYVAGGGSVIMSSHSLDLIQRVCDHVAVIIDGSVIAQGTVDAVRDGMSLEDRFRHLTESSEAGEGLEWLHGSSDSE
ncbi:ABC transporter ATP-binding protein [Leucobacter tardus]|uniref:ABC transporter ATP-binding protein n=1 Tax=Leucobacter tardus TaxID=501483 RepID=A0A939QEY9_9MICO|nr:ABC transporter ATP-binding protein [Leucobacter tardus]